LFLQKQRNFFENTQLFTNSQHQLTHILPQLFEESLNEEIVAEKYINIRQLSFISFFIQNMVDVLIWFRKSKSLKNKSIDFVFIKLSNLLMRKGKREKYIRIFLKSFFLFYNEFQKNISELGKVFYN